VIVDAINLFSREARARKRSRVDGNKRIKRTGIQSGPCRVGSFAPDGFGVVGVSSDRRAIYGAITCAWDSTRSGAGASVCPRVRP
jgi:hypothetical protein